MASLSPAQVTPEPAASVEIHAALVGANGVVPCGPSEGPECASRFDRVVLFVSIENREITPLAIAHWRVDLQDESSREVRFMRELISLSRMPVDNQAWTLASEPADVLAAARWPALGVEAPVFDNVVAPHARTLVRLWGWLGAGRGERRVRVSIHTNAGTVTKEQRLLVSTWTTG
ncbi:MAG: hypothetical protein Q8Q09_07060 [Deltaproteobacteria bacterium]|nr:hypothetical protein [Deltaproteobacteria bacterium]